VTPNTSNVKTGIGQKFLVTLDNWFYAPDGKHYRAAFGTLRAVLSAEDALGIKPNGRSTNWYMQVGDLLIAGCQVHFAIRCESCHGGDAKNWQIHEGRTHEYVHPTAIYFADGTS